MPTDPQLSASELDAAIERIGHQLELLRAGPTLGAPSDDGSVVAELQAELAALIRMRANITADSSS